MIRDHFDRQAHDIICMLSFGSRGGGVRTEQMHKVGDYLRGGPIKLAAPKLVVTLPKKIEVKVPCSKPVVVVQLKK